MFQRLAAMLRPLFHQWLQPRGHTSVPRQLNLETLEQRLNPSLGFGFAVGGSSASSEAIATTTDSSGNVYATGVFTGATNFGNTTLKAQGSDDAFVAKYNPMGSLDWVADLGGANDSVTGLGIAVDRAGNVYTTGDFTGIDINFDPNSSNHQISSADSGIDENAYVSKLNASGQYVFAVDLGYGTFSTGRGIAVDGSDNLSVTGYFAGTNVDFAPDGSNLLSSSNSGSNTNAYVSKLNSSGNYVFAVDLGSGGNAFGDGIALDGSGNICTTGTFNGSNLNFDPNSSNHQLSASGGDNNAYVSKLNSSGQYVFGVDLGSGGSVFGASIAVDGSGDVYSTGFFLGSNLNFDPSGGNDLLSSSNAGNDENAYVSKLDSTGQYVFGVDLGFGGHSVGSGLALDGSGNVYITGNFAGTNVNFAPSGGSRELTSSHSGIDMNAFISELNSSGGYVLGVDLGDGDTSFGQGLAVDGSDNIVTSGIFNGANVNFNPTGTSDLTNSGQNLSFFLSKLTQLQITPTTLPNSVQDAFYDVSISVTDGKGPFTFSISNGALPTGLSLNPSTGDLSGTLTAPGTFTFTISAADAIGDSTSQSYTMVVAYQSLYANSAYSYTYAAYLDAYYAYVTNTGSYSAFFYEYYANFFATNAAMYASADDAADAENFAYYAYYYGYFGEYFAYQDYAHSGGTSIYSYDAYYNGYFGSTYSYYTASGY